MDTKTILLIVIAALLFVVWLPVLVVSVRETFHEIKKRK
jgi:hypothetical protein